MCRLVSPNFMAKSCPPNFDHLFQKSFLVFKRNLTGDCTSVSTTEIYTFPPHTHTHKKTLDPTKQSIMSPSYLKSTTFFSDQHQRS